MNKKILKDFIPPIALRLLSGMQYGWHGDYPDWTSAMNRVTGYDSLSVLNKVKASVGAVRDGKAVYERDSVLFDKIQYSFPLLSALMWISVLKGGKLNVLDFGGSLGSTYYQNKFFLDTLNEVNWCVVEQPEFVSAGRLEFSDSRLHFYYSVSECLNTHSIDVVVLSSVLQYLESPSDFLAEIKTLDFRYLIIDRTPFIRGKDRITVQNVNPKIYKASYPCWFFNEDKFLSVLSPEFGLILEFDALDKSNIKSEFKGFLFKKKMINNV
jgi:putative methyltransferase (TIGR04325 family)